MKKGKIKTKEREAEVMARRIKGQSYQQIAEEMGYSQTGCVYKVAQRCLERTIKESTGEVICFSTLQLDRLQEAWDERALTDPKAAKLLLEIMDRRAKLLGLVQDKVEHEHKVTHVKIKWNESDERPPSKFDKKEEDNEED